MGLVRMMGAVLLLALACGCTYKDFVGPVLTGIREGFTDYRAARDAADREEARRADARNAAVISAMKDNKTNGDGLGLKDALVPATLLTLAGGALAVRKKENGGSA